MDAEVTVREIMTREYLGVSESDTVRDAVDLMLEEGSAAVVVLRGTDPVGMLTADDALELITTEADPEGTEVRSVMSGTVPTVEPDAAVSEAAGAMADAGIGSLLVRSGETVSGLISERDVVRATATLADHASLTGSATPPGPGSAGAADVEVTTGEDAGEYSTQSVCENCGSLTHDLRNFNGQLICDNCREV